MKISTKKSTTMIALILMLTIAITPVAVPLASAHDPPFIVPTWAFISVEPNPSGVGQALFINFWLDKVPPTAAQFYGDRWHNFTVAVTKPDGSKITLGPFSSDAVGGAATTYTPDQLGTYSFVFSFPGQTVTGENPPPGGTTTNPQQIGDYFQPSTSRTATVVVTQEQVQYLPSNPLPTGYWSRPIFAQNNNWYSIGGNWLGAGAYNATGNFAPYTAAPNTGHIVWTKPYAPGGLIGGEYGDSRQNSNYYSTAQYETKFSPIIMNGILYYTLIPGSSTSRQGWVAVDIRTGEEIWFKSTPNALLRGQLFDYVSPNQFGALAYLWDTHPNKSPNTGTTYGMYDAMTGEWILDIVNGSSVTWVSSAGGYGSQGEMLGYYINTRDWTMNLWNSSRCILLGQGAQQGITSDINWQWRPPQGGSISWNLGIEWSVPMATTITADNGTMVNINAAYAESAGVSANLAIAKIADVILVTNTPGPQTSFQQPGYIITEAYSLQDGHLLWGPLNLTLTKWARIRGPATMSSGVFTVFTFETQEYSGYSTTTGQKLWGPVSIADPNDPWGYYVTSYENAYGNLYSADFGGHVYCIDLQTGTIKWNFWTGTSGYETPYGVWPIVNFQCIADGKIYVNGGHLYSPPLFQGGMVYCLNATSGDLLWSMPDFAITNGAASAVADGYFVLPNAYDNQLYTYGMGPSATEVSIQNDVVTFGSSVLLKGMVTDESAGTKTTDKVARFPNGVPAISDENMDAWMQYVWMQQACPADLTGVPVHLTAIDPNGNYQDIGIATSNALGNFAFVYNPPVPGLYTVTATFEGSNSYFSSMAGTSFVVTSTASAAVVTPAPTSTSTETPSPTSVPTQAPISPSPSVAPQPTSGIPTTTYIAIAAAVVIIAVIAAALVLRKRK